MDFRNWQAQVRRGLLDVIVMNMLGHGERHGYEMAQRLKQLKGLAVREGNIYPILARLQVDGLIGTRVRPSPDGPPRKHYKLTKAGVQTLKRMSRYLDELMDGLHQVRGKGRRPKRSASGRKQRRP
jgi:PadR family transcriptional regulator PadR